MLVGVHSPGSVMAENNDLKRILPPTGNLDFELVGHSARAGRMPVHSFKIRTTLESGERLDITEHVAMTLDRKTTRDGALNEGGMGYYKPDAIAGSLAEALYDQDRHYHTFKVRTSEEVSQAEWEKHELVKDLRTTALNSTTAGVVQCLKEGADPNGRDQYGRTPLHLVGQQDYSNGYAASGETATALLAAGADPNARDFSGNTPLHTAMNGPVALALLEGGADFQVKNDDGDTPLVAQLARRGDAAEIIETFEKRQTLASQATRPDDDLADVEEIESYLVRGRRM